MAGADAAETYAAPADKDAQHHGDGGKASGNLETLDEKVVGLTFEQNKVMRQLKEADSIFKELGVALGASSA